MIKDLKTKLKKLETPSNMFSGARVGDAPALPENILVFKRGDVCPTPKTTNIHHRFLLSVNLGEPCELVMDGVRFSIGRGEAVLIHPNQHHIFIHDHPGIMRLMASFETDLDSALLPPKDKVFPVGAKELSLASTLLDYYLEDADGLSCSLTLALLLRRLKRLPQTKAGKRPPTLMDSIIAFIQGHLDEPMSIAKLAKRFNMSASNLRLRFRQGIGMSIGRYMLESRLNRAKGYLGDSDMKVDEVARRCGYNSLFSFSHTFKRHAGVSPLRYRQSSKKIR